MKKNVLALSIAAAVAGFGAMGSAHAVTTIYNGMSPAAGVYTPAGDAQYLKLNPSGIGHMLLVPYFTTQASNVTLISIVNTDAVNGKAVKVRIRGAGNSDDLFDFQVFLSPNDVWTANINKDANGLSQITSADGSCMKGLTKGVAAPFSKLRLDKKVPSTDAAVIAALNLNNQTREGYVEIFNMADIAPTLYVTGLVVTTGTDTMVLPGSVANPIYAGVLHTAGVATCAGLSGLDVDAAGWAGLTAPTTGLMGEWLIINQQTAAGYGGNDTAIQALNSSFAPGYGNIVYWPQTRVVFDKWPSSAFTADPLLAGDLLLSGTNLVVPAVLPLLQDFPDMSTPYTARALQAATDAGNRKAGPVYQAYDLTRSLAVTSLANEFLTEPSIAAASDFVFSMPTRRYNVAMNYETLLPSFTDYTAFSYSNFFAPANTQASGRQVCVWGLTQTAYDQNEQRPSAVVPSPQAIPMFCGEVSVFGINQAIVPVTGSSKVLAANIAVQGADVGTSNYAAGWLKVATPGLGVGSSILGLPVLGGSFTQAVGSASGSNFGVNTDHRSTRISTFGF